MYRYKLEDVTTEAGISFVIDKFKANEVPRFEKLERYYHVKNEILNRVAKDEKPNNRLAHGFCKYIAKMATGYFMGKGIRFELPSSAQRARPLDTGESKEQDEYKNLLTNVLEHNYTDGMNFEIAKEASKKGVAFEILYIDEQARLRTQKLDAESVIPVYSQKLGEFLECAIRIWKEVDLSGTQVTEFAELYTKTDVLSFVKRPEDPQYRLTDAKAHGFDDIPVVVYWNNEEQIGDYESVISLIDAYDKSQSDTANDSEYFTDAYMVIAGALGGFSGDGEDEEDQSKAARDMRRERILYMDEKGQVQWLIKDVNDTALENYKNRLYKDIFFISQVPALSDESFAGNLTGIAIRYKLIGLDELTTEKENKFRSAQKKKFRMITEFINTKHNKNFDSDGIIFKFERNFIDNQSDSIADAQKLAGVTSKETALGLLPFVKDPAVEMERIRLEEAQADGESDIYSSKDFRKIKNMEDDENEQ